MMGERPNVLISACLMGAPVRYDGRGKRLCEDLIDRLAAVCQLVPLCPELAGGFQVPRPPAEIENGMTGGDVLDGTARVMELGGRDVTALFLAGAEANLKTRLPGPQDEEILRLKAMIGDLTMRNEVLRERSRAMEANLPLGLRRSRR